MGHSFLASSESVPRETLSINQQRAIQRIIRAKSDREIARLLRQSYRLLNLHTRHRSNWSRRERWADYELRLLGRMRDEEMAKLFRRSPNAVAAKREAKHVECAKPQNR